MRILTLLAGPDSVPDAVRLTAEIRAFNAEIDFRLRFLHIEIEEAFVAAPEAESALQDRIERVQILPVRSEDPLEAAARLALILSRERPDLFVISGGGSLQEPGMAAAAATSSKLAFFGAGRGCRDGAIDLGEDPTAAIERMSGVAREIS